MYKVQTGGGSFGGHVTTPTGPRRRRRFRHLLPKEMAYINSVWMREKAKCEQNEEEFTASTVKRALETGGCHV